MAYGERLPRNHREIVESLYPTKAPAMVKERDDDCRPCHGQASHAHATQLLSVCDRA